MPSRSKLDKAARSYEEFSGHPARGVRRIAHKPFHTGWLLGHLEGVLYSAKRDGKVEKYIHRFRKSARPLLVVSVDGKSLGIVGGRFLVTESGINDG